MEEWLANLIDGLEHSTPQGREEAAALRQMNDELEALDFERTALRAERDELLAALRNLLGHCEIAAVAPQAIGRAYILPLGAPVLCDARDAIAKVGRFA